MVRQGVKKMGCGHEDYPCCGCGTDEALSQDDFDDMIGMRDGLDASEYEDERWYDEDEPQPDDCPEDEPHDGFRDDVEADADTLRSCGWGTDEDYGYYGD